MLTFHTYVITLQYASFVLVVQETLTAQLAEKNSELQKWREERDQLVTAVETQMKALLSSCKHKDEEIQELRKAAAKSTGTVSGRRLFLYLLVENYFSKLLLSCVDSVYQKGYIAFCIFSWFFIFLSLLLISQCLEYNNLS